MGHVSAPGFYDELRALRLERLLDASVAIITEEGWDRLSMTKVAQRSGVPRQSLYKEVGTTSELGEAVVHYGLGNFLFKENSAEGARTGVFEVTVTGRRVDSYRWIPGQITNSVPRPLIGAAATDALAYWNGLRSCAGLIR